MMIPMAIVALVGGGLAIVVVLFIHHRAAVARRAAAAHLQHEVQDKIKRAKVLDAHLAQQVLDGADIDASINDFTKSRAAVHALPSETPWLWEVDDLTKWTKTQLASMAAAINHRARLIALSLLVAIVLTVSIIDAILYGQLSAAPSVLSPLPPAFNVPAGQPAQPSSTLLAPGPSANGGPADSSAPLSAPPAPLPTMPPAAPAAVPPSPP